MNVEMPAPGKIWARLNCSVWLGMGTGYAMPVGKAYPPERI